MTKRKKILVGLGGTLLLLAIVAGAAVYYILTKSLPQTRGSLTLPGLSAPVDVYRDELGIPHIIAGGEYDLYFAAGFVTAQDRLWQMDVARRYGEGRLSEIFGARAVEVDRLARTIGFSRIADTLLRSCSRQTRNLLDAYARGVNAAITLMKDKLPVEYDLLQYRPEPWTPKHSLIVARLMGWELAVSWWVDLTLYDLVQRIGPEKAAEVFPFDDPAMPEIVRSRRLADAPSADPFLRRNLLARDLFQRGGSAIGSNSWTVTRSKSVSGLPILANDPHLELMQPARFYLMHLSAPGYNVAGVTLPGAPGVLIGHNDRIAWGLTNVMADDVDFYLERINNNDSTFEYEGKRKRLTIIVDTIHVRDSLPVPCDIRLTRNGPLISDVFLQPAAGGFRGYRFQEMLSMRWVGMEASDEILSLYRVNHAATWSDFTEALRTFGVPGQNFLYADKEGNIGYLCAAKVPIRSVRAAMLPANGWDGKEAWDGFVPFEKMPRTFNPPEDYIATANNRPAGGLPFHLSNLWEGDSRIRRVLEMLRDQTVFTYNDFRLMQMDLLSPYARDVTSSFVRALEADSAPTPELSGALRILRRWDFRMYSSSVAAAIFNVAHRHLLAATFEDEMGRNLFERYIFISNIPTRVLPKLLADTVTTWFDNVLTPGHESRDMVLRDAVRLACEELRNRFGEDMNGWTWGKLHQVVFRHPMGEVQPLDRLFNVGPFDLGGNTTTVNNGEFSYVRPYEARVGPAMRMIVNLASLDTCSFILTTGQSGQPLSRHYANQTVFWQNGAYHPLLTNPAAVVRANWDHLTLQP